MNRGVDFEVVVLLEEDVNDVGTSVQNVVVLY
jgi:hypothetical protein